MQTPLPYFIFIMSLCCLLRSTVALFAIPRLAYLSTNLNLFRGWPLELLLNVGLIIPPTYFTLTLTLVSAFITLTCPLLPLPATHQSSFFISCTCVWNSLFNQDVSAPSGFSFNWNPFYYLLFLSLCFHSYYLFLAVVCCYFLFSFKLSFSSHQLSDLLSSSLRDLWFSQFILQQCPSSKPVRTNSCVTTRLDSIWSVTDNAIVDRGGHLTWNLKPLSHSLWAPNLYVQDTTRDVMHPKAGPPLVVFDSTCTSLKTIIIHVCY